MQSTSLPEGLKLKLFSYTILPDPARGSLQERSSSSEGPVHAQGSAWVRLYSGEVLVSSLSLSRLELSDTKICEPWYEPSSKPLYDSAARFVWVVGLRGRTREAAEVAAFEVGREHGVRDRVAHRLHQPPASCSPENDAPQTDVRT